MKRLVEVTVNNGDVPIRGEDNFERLLIRRGDSLEYVQNGCCGEHGNVIDGHDKGTNIFATDISDS